MLVCYLGFDVGEFSEDGSDDVEGMDASAAHVANLLSTEPADSMLHKCNNILVCLQIFVFVLFLRTHFKFKQPKAIIIQ